MVNPRAVLRKHVFRHASWLGALAVAVGVTLFFMGKTRGPYLDEHGFSLRADVHRPSTWPPTIEETVLLDDWLHPKCGRVGTFVASRASHQEVLLVGGSPAHGPVLARVAGYLSRMSGALSVPITLFADCGNTTLESLAQDKIIRGAILLNGNQSRPCFDAFGHRGVASNFDFASLFLLQAAVPFCGKKRQPLLEILGPFARGAAQTLALLKFASAGAPEGRTALHTRLHQLSVPVAAVNFVSPLSTVDPHQEWVTNWITQWLGSFEPHDEALPAHVTDDALALAITGVVAPMANLHERLHHSFNSWIPATAFRAWEHNTLQLAPLFVGGAMFADAGRLLRLLRPHETSARSFGFALILLFFFHVAGNHVVDWMSLGTTVTVALIVGFLSPCSSAWIETAQWCRFCSRAFCGALLYVLVALNPSAALLLSFGAATFFLPPANFKLKTAVWMKSIHFLGRCMRLLLASLWLAVTSETILFNSRREPSCVVGGVAMMFLLASDWWIV